jgi:glycosyltransferase involved in cell wall biosynthesis
MKIGISINTSWNVYNFRKGLVLDLLKKGHQVLILAPRDDYSSKLEELGCTFIELPMRNKSYNPFYDFLLLVKYIFLLKKLNLDYLLTYTIKPNIYASLASKFSSTRVIANVSGLGTTFLTNNIGAKIARKLYKNGLRFSHLVFFQNNDDKELFIKNKIIKEHKTAVLPGSGVDLNFYKTTKPLPNKKRFTVIARTLFAKGILEYIEAIKLIKKDDPEIKFQWVGKAEPEEGLGVDTTQLKEWGHLDLIHYIPFTDNVKSIIENSSCIVLPSYREGTPKSLLEGMAMSRPIITTDVPGCKNLVNNGENGFICEVKNANSLANAIKGIVNSSNNELTLMGEKSRKLVENEYSQEIIIERYNDILQKWR